MFPESHSTYSASRYSHMPLSLAHTSHFAFLLAANFSKSSSHLVAGLPRVRSPLLGSQCKTRVDHLPSVRLATCPAHFHLRRLCSVTQSTSVPLSGDLQWGDKILQVNYAILLTRLFAFQHMHPLSGQISSATLEHVRSMPSGQYFTSWIMAHG